MRPPTLVKKPLMMIFPSGWRKRFCAQLFGPFVHKRWVKRAISRQADEIGAASQVVLADAEIGTDMTRFPTDSPSRLLGRAVSWQP